MVCPIMRSPHLTDAESGSQRNWSVAPPSRRLSRRRLASAVTLRYSFLCSSISRTIPQAHVFNHPTDARLASLGDRAASLRCLFVYPAADWIRDLDLQRRPGLAHD